MGIYDGIQAAYVSGMPTTILGAGGVLSTAVSVLLYVVGALSVIMIIVGGLRYAISGGNSTAVTAAKNTILYAIIGLVVAFLAYAIINIVLGFLTGTSGIGGAGGNGIAPTSV